MRSVLCQGYQHPASAAPREEHRGRATPRADRSPAPGAAPPCATRTTRRGGPAPARSRASTAHHQENRHEPHTLGDVRPRPGARRLHHARGRVPPIDAGQENNAKVKVADTGDGFTVEVRYSRYQFVPETGALLTACRSLATARALEEARHRGREIEPVDEQAVRESTGRNIVTARTACRAFIEVRWKR
jgi:hypothetical protein